MLYWSAKKAEGSSFVLSVPTDQRFWSPSLRTPKTENHSCVFLSRTTNTMPTCAATDPLAGSLGGLLVGLGAATLLLGTGNILGVSGICKSFFFLFAAPSLCWVRTISSAPPLAPLALLLLHHSASLPRLWFCKLGQRCSATARKPEPPAARVRRRRRNSFFARFWVRTISFRAASCSSRAAPPSPQRKSPSSMVLQTRAMMLGYCSRT